jgi:hypothetical protein
MIVKGVLSVKDNESRNLIIISSENMYVSTITFGVNFRKLYVPNSAFLINVNQLHIV